MYCLCVNVYCTTATGWLPNCSKKIWYDIWYHTVSYIILHHISYHIISYHIISYHIISYHIISYHIISYHIIYHIISYHISYHISYPIVSFHIVSYHLISYHIVSYPILSYSAIAVLVSEYPNMEFILQFWPLAETLQSFILMNLVAAGHFPLTLYKRGWKYNRCCHLQAVRLLWRVSFLKFSVPCILLNTSSDTPNNFIYFFFCSASTQRGSWPPHFWGF